MKKLCHFLFFCILTFVSCKQDVDIDKLVIAFSEIQCRAITLKDKRYELADHLRNIEVDSILKKKEIDSLRLVIKNTKYQSLMVADSIKNKLNDLFKNELSDKEKQKEFTSRLENFITKHGCGHQ